MINNFASYLVLAAVISALGPGAFGMVASVKNVNVTTYQGGVQVEVELSAPAHPVTRITKDPSAILICFPGIYLEGEPQKSPVHFDGVEEVAVQRGCWNQPGTEIEIRIDHARPYGISEFGNTYALTVLPHSIQLNPMDAESAGQTTNDTPNVASAETPVQGLTAAPPPPPDVEYAQLDATIDEVAPNAKASLDPKVAPDPAANIRHRFRVKYVTADGAYLDGGTNAGLRVGMSLDIVRSQAQDSASAKGDLQETPIATAQIVGVATTSAVVEIANETDPIKIGDWADLLPGDAAIAARNILNPESASTVLAAVDTEDESEPSDSAPPLGKSFLSTRESLPVRTRMGGRIGFDYSGISSFGSTPGVSEQMGMSVQSDMKNILGTHWNLEGYWRTRFNHHSQFQEDTIDETLSKTYTMQLYYDNPTSKWVAGAGRLYLPWAVSLDTVDGGYLGRKSRFGMTTGIFGGSTPDITSWHFRPDQRIGGIFTNFQGGDYDRFHFSSTTGAALTSIGWKLDRPFLFFENELSYKSNISIFHSLIVDSPQGVTTNGIRPGIGISHSYFTLHYQPAHAIGFDLYHNYFRDVPTAATTMVGTGLVDSLLFQGISGGVHLRPTRYFTLYTTMGASEKTGDLHRSLNRMFGGTWNGVGRTGPRIDFHYSKFYSDFGTGDYKVLTVSRQVSSRMFWNLQMGNQNLLSQNTANYNSKFISHSVDLNLGRKLYIQSGYTYVNGATLNYHQWFTSMGFRFDQGKNNPEYVETPSVYK